MRILIAGCGDIGNLLGEHAARLGDVVWGIRRNPDRVAQSIKPIALDLTQPVDPAKLPHGIDQVYYLPTPGERSRAAYERVFVDGLRNLLVALNGRSATRLMYVSSTSVYGENDGSQVSALSPAHPASETAKALRRGEDAALASGLNTSVIRFSGIYGRGRSRLIDRVLKAQHIVSDTKWTNRIHRCDCAKVLRYLANLRTPTSHYLASDNAPTTERQVMDFIADALGVAHLPNTASEPQSVSGKRCDNSHLLDTGYEFQYPDFRTGYQEMVTEYRQQQASS